MAQKKRSTSDSTVCGIPEGMGDWFIPAVGENNKPMQPVWVSEGNGWTRQFIEHHFQIGSIDNRYVDKGSDRVMNKVKMFESIAKDLAKKARAVGKEWSNQSIEDGWSVFDARYAIKVEKPTEDGVFVIRDGQHRFLACLILGIPFAFWVDSREGSVALENSSCDRWKPWDYMRSWLLRHKGTPAYKNYQQVAKYLNRDYFRGSRGLDFFLPIREEGISPEPDRNLTLNWLLTTMGGGNPQGSQTTKFVDDYKAGTYRVTRKGLSNLKDILELYDAIRKYHPLLKGRPFAMFCAYWLAVEANTTRLSRDRLFTRLRNLRRPLKNIAGDGSKMDYLVAEISEVYGENGILQHWFTLVAPSKNRVW